MTGYGALHNKHKHNLNDVTDAELVSGVTGLFIADWIKADIKPQATGNYLVVVRNYEPIVALFIESKGWILDNTEHIGLEDLITYWMKLPEPPKEK